MYIHGESGRATLDPASSYVYTWLNLLEDFVLISLT